MEIVNKVSQAVPSFGRRQHGTGLSGEVRKGSAITASGWSDGGGADSKPFDSMNNIVANLLLNMTRLVWCGRVGCDASVGQCVVGCPPFPRYFFPCNCCTGRHGFLRCLPQSDRVPVMLGGSQNPMSLSALTLL